MPGVISARRCDAGEGTTGLEQNFEILPARIKSPASNGSVPRPVWKQRVPAEASSYSDGRINNSGSLAMLMAMRPHSDAFHLDEAKSGVRVFNYVQDQATRPARE